MDKEPFKIGDTVLYYPLQKSRDCYGNTTAPPKAIEAEISGIAENNLRLKRFEKKLFGKKKIEVWINIDYFEVKKVKE